MFAKTIDQAVNNAVGAVADRAEPRFQDALDEANRHALAMRRELTQQVEFATWVISGAVVLGFILSAVISRAGGD